MQGCVSQWLSWVINTTVCGEIRTWVFAVTPQSCTLPLDQCDLQRHTGVNILLLDSAAARGRIGFRYASLPFCGRTGPHLIQNSCPVCGNSQFRCLATINQRHVRTQHITRRQPSRSVMHCRQKINQDKLLNLWCIITQYT